MRISKRSPRKSDAFKSRFVEAGREAAPIRHARWLREELAGLFVHAVLQAGFAVALVFFGRSLFHLFSRHGADLNPLYLRLSLLSVLVCFVLVVRRLVMRILEMREVRSDLATANRQLEAMREAGRRPPRT